ncbi:hypothetical protein J2Y58_002271 [Sphingomonas sp. BE138]|nr:hypothetical protein [Sphingomonas sp. BE138]
MLLRHLADRELLVSCWTEVRADQNVAFHHGQQALRWIVAGLVERSHPVRAQFRRRVSSSAR